MSLIRDVDNAPFHIGERVRVLNNPNNDETIDEQFTFKLGFIIYLEYDCGCGQSFPEDPMIGVRFENGAVEEFWKEELTSTG